MEVRAGAGTFTRSTESRVYLALSLLMLRRLASKRFGSLERWVDDFRAASLAANGWGILARDAVNGQLYNVASDLHEVGVLWFGQPLVVCDVYEHAFYVDYQNRKADYIGKFLQHINWDEVNRRWHAVG
jgi:Fe-Mn family superoxide dismutase